MKRVAPPAPFFANSKPFGDIEGLQVRYLLIGLESSDLRNISDQIEPPTDVVTEHSMKKAAEENSDRLLRHSMSRFAYGRAVAAAVQLHELPPLHLMDHRVRLPRWLGGRAADPDKMRSHLVHRLERMLVANPHAGGRELVKVASRCDPAADADRLLLARSTSPDFVDLVLCGRLGSAMELISQLGSTVFGEEGARTIVAQMLVYHAALQAQLIAARGRVIDRLLLRLSSSPSAYTEKEACKHLSEVLAAIGKIIEKTSGETSQPPQRQLVKDLIPRAAELRMKIEADDVELTEQAMTYFASRREELQRLQESLERINKKATVQSLHKALFGVTSVEALIFAATRFVQLRNLASKFVEAPVDTLNAYIPIENDQLPTIDDKDVARLVFVYRALILRDDAAPDIVDDGGRDIDLAAAWRANSSGNLPGGNTIKKRSRFLNSPDCKREFLVQPIGKRLAGGQRIDILPEFLLQLYPGVGGVLPGSTALVRAKKKREQDRAHRPANAWKAPKRSVRP